MVRLLRKKYSPAGDKENAPRIAEVQKPRRLRFRRKKDQQIPCAANGASADTSVTSASELSAQPESSTILPFSSLAEMAILHNSVSNSVSEDKPDSLPPTPSTALKTRSVLQFALQSRMYEKNAAWDSICDDPPVEESIECVFEHQLEDGLEMNVEEDEESCMDNGDNACSPYRESQYTSGKLVQVGSFSPFNKNDIVKVALQYISRPLRSDLASGRTKRASFTCNTCRDGKQTYLGIPPEGWPQAPLYLRPTPGSRTDIIGVRYADSTEYLTTQWWNDIPNNVILKKESQSWCPKCCCLPINNGNETLGKALVVDFESELFQGTLQVRIRRANGTTPEPYDDTIGYFNGLNRHYQCVIQGRFKLEGIPMIRCVAGQSFTEPLNLPPAYIVKGGIRIMNLFAPRLQMKMEGHSPFITSPLGSTPQTVQVDHFNNTANASFRASSLISEEQEEPDNESRQIVPIKLGNDTSTSASRTKARKKAFDRLCEDGDDTLTFDTNRVYSFEFVQHLVDFQTFDLSLGNMLGKMDLSQALNGQPIKIMAAYQRLPPGSGDREEKVLFDNLWSFDLWNEKAYYEMLKKG